MSAATISWFLESPGARAVLGSQRVPCKTAHGRIPVSCRRSCRCEPRTARAPPVLPYQSLTGRLGLVGFAFGLLGSICSSPFCVSNNCCACSGVICPAAAAVAAACFSSDLSSGFAFDCLACCCCCCCFSCSSFFCWSFLVCCCFCSSSFCF